MEDGAGKTKLIEELDKIDYQYLLNQPKFDGKNTFKLNADQLPQHKHGMEHKHKGTTGEAGEQRHELFLIIQMK